ncbi:MAG: TIGR03663 family protein [Thermoflexales bacterium]|nr:TIGR03663 family protein [Thermoflexales bacterium]
MKAETLKHETTSTWLDRPLSSLKFDYEKGLYLLFILGALLTRFYRLGERVMSHDESLHTYFSWNLYTGRGFSHTPLMHGPFLFHINTLMYTLFGADDFTARISTALFGVVLVGLPWALRRWLGRAGALVVSFMFLISPAIMYYARYIRNESFVTVWAVLIVWATFAFFQKRQERWLYLYVIAHVLLFTTKEVSFIYTAIFGTFLVILLVWQLVSNNKLGLDGLGGIGAAAGGGAVALVIALLLQYTLLNAMGLGPSGSIAADGVPKETIGPNLPVGSVIAYLGLLGLIAAAAGAAVYFLLRRLMPQPDRIASGTGHAAFDLLITVGTLYLPTLSPFAMHVLKIDPMDYGPAGIVRAGGIFLLFLAISIAVGLWWDARRWAISAGLWYGIGITLFTSVFTNGGGIASGFVGSLGYWIVQQGVQRGSQPLYYYLIITPLYEYFPILISLTAALYYGVKAASFQSPAPASDQATVPSDDAAGQSNSKGLFLLFLAYWITWTWGIYSYAGEKMPWLIVHFSLPMILLAGAFLGDVIQSTDWRSLGAAWLASLLTPLLLIGLTSLSSAMAAGAFRGDQTTNLVATGQWFSGLLAVVGAGAALFWLVMRVGADKTLRVLGLSVVVLLAISTFRTAWRWNFINADYVNEHGVYAHGGPGVKLALQQIEEIADRTVGRSQIKVAYDSDSSWPFTWYLRDYPSQSFFGSTPTRQALDAPIVIAGNASWSTVEQILGKNYESFTYRLVWWPMEDYKGKNGRSLTWSEIAQALGNGQMRAALWDIFWSRDYNRYDQITTKTHAPDKWPLVHDFKLYMRRDVAAQVWSLGIGPAIAREPIEDPYAKGRRTLAAVQVIGGEGSQTGQFSAPHGLALGPDGSLYVADSNNHRIQKFSPDGQFILSFGTPSGTSGDGASAPAGTFNEPWSVAVAPDGNAVYVADTWNHRIQKFSPDGQFIAQWGKAGQTDGTLRDDPANYYILWGPRDVAVDSDGNVYVTDTGDKRIVVFDSNGKYLRQLGGKGFEPGQLDEPVGLACSPDNASLGNDVLVVADTWNQRIQVLTLEGAALRNWAIDGWIGQAVTNKPYLAVGPGGTIYTTDPTGFRVLVFQPDGTFVATFGDIGTDNTSFQQPVGIAVDNAGYVWVSDAGTGRVLKFPPLD